MSYQFDLERVRRAKLELDKWFYGVPKGKQPKDIWKHPISEAPNSGYRNKIFSRTSGIVDLHGTVEQAFNDLMNYANKNKDKDVKERFMTMDEIEYWANYMKKEFEQYLGGKTYPLLTYVDFIVAYYVVASFRGFAAEYEFSDWLNKVLHNSTCYNEENITPEICNKFGCKDHDELDRKLMVDLLTDDDCALQIKNKSFLFGGGYESFENDYNKLKEAEKELKKFGVNYFFAFYEPDGGWVRKQKDGRYIFSSSEIFSIFDNNLDVKKRQKLMTDKFEKGEFFVSKLV